MRDEDLRGRQPPEDEALLADEDPVVELDAEEALDEELAPDDEEEAPLPPVPASDVPLLADPEVALLDEDVAPTGVRQPSAASKRSTGGPSTAHVPFGTPR